MFIINVTRSERKGKSYNSTHKITTLCPISLNLSLCLTFNTLISHVRTSPRWKWEKFSTGAAAKAQSRVARVDWADGVSVEWSREPFFKKRPQWGFPWFRSVPGPRRLQLTGPPLRSAAAASMKRILRVDTRWQELMWSSTSVTAFISYAMPLIPWLGDISDTLF